ncbi:MAG: four helix bundle protein [Ignavibacteriota bacterium]|nr:MAG: four helix bundle protein [Chlorobiota bacterium]MBE7478067.1 four helix bundle protein [Ignavibacteriales bacterium]MBL1123372.1 four helix bundle protein [Ignavibacteriota bacterium]MCC7094566.1 four helix bundle protein [Ignavibacteriaceae bacterium]MCE7856655.1 four helix bundle protein [Ignavibacteria bacterium CHB3]MEB2296534.1 four helix bundle protein [Ignavibacteria bacterium]
MHNYKELKVWQKARELVKFTYQLTKKFPKEEIYSLISQVRRAVVSIPFNIAEGAGHSSKKEFSRFLEIAYASTCELDTQIILSFDLEFINQTELNDSTNYIKELQKILNGLIKSLKK